MNKETLRMQMLAGIITEEEYNTKLDEETEQDFNSFEKKLEEILKDFTGDDVFLVSDEDDEIVYVEILTGPNKTRITSAIKAALKETPAYKIDPESRDKSPDGDISFTIIKKE
jgi:hypothetical protein